MSPIEQVRRDRIRVSVHCIAYERFDDPLLSDSEYDKLAYKVYDDREQSTGNKRLDNFFKRKFTPYTGSWIYQHPDRNKIIQTYYYLKRRGLWVI